VPCAANAAVEDMLAENDMALLRHELDELHAIDAALERIACNVGGLCTVCGAPIPIERLRVLPIAATCVACAASAAH
jgi:DnaK suppressor protein